MDEWLKVIILGVIEGITEFLPISSTGHLIVAANYVQLRESLSGVFEIFIQIGAVVAVVLYYRMQLWQQVTTVYKDVNIQRLWLGVAIAFVPAVVLGLLFGDAIDAVLFRPEVVAVSLIVGGIMFIVAEWYLARGKNMPENRDLMTESLTLKQSLLVGLCQVLALIPGMSRSGMSIIGGMLSGIDRQRATQFSFYLAIPTLGGATVYTLLKNLSTVSSDDLWMLMLGAAVSGIVAWFAIDWLLRYISKNNFVIFGYYRIILGVIILVITLVIQ